MTQLVSVARMNRALWRSCVEGAELVLWSRPLGSVNAIGFVALHLVDARYFTLGLLGVAIPNPFSSLLAGARSMADLREHPSLGELVAAWNTVAGPFEQALGAVPAEALLSPTTQKFPIDDPTLAGALHFLQHHESYHIGQMALLRRCFDLPAMRYG